MGSNKWRKVWLWGANPKNAPYFQQMSITNYENELEDLRKVYIPVDLTKSSFYASKLYGMNQHKKKLFLS